jgi:glycosyltransferase involved in cell wall biosynthesis
MAIRPDAENKLGGDTVQMRETAKGLRALGLEVRESVGEPSPEDWEWAKIAHLFNLQTPVFTLRLAKSAKELGKPIALSTIYWDFGAERLIASSPRWKLLTRVMGRKAALGLAHRRVESAAQGQRSLLSEILGMADVCLPNSEAEIGHLRRMREPLPPCRVVPNGVDPSVYDPERDLPLPQEIADCGVESKGYLLVAARLDPDKNQLAFCRALAGTDIPIVLAGVDADRDYLEACLAAGAEWAGELRGEPLMGAYRHARVHALPSFRETPGLANLEAAAMGCAVVSTCLGSAREYFGSGAHYCDPASAPSMREAALAAWNHGPPAGLSERIRTEFAWKRAAEETLAAYRSIIESPKS